MSEGDMVEAVARAIYKAVTPPESRWECVEPVYQEGVWRAYARAALSVIESRVRAEERERAARIALEYAAPLRRNAKDATDGVGYVVNEGCALVAESIARAIRSGDAG